MTGLVIYILFIVSCTTPPSQPPTASPLPATTGVILLTITPPTNTPTRAPTETVQPALPAFDDHDSHLSSASVTLEAGKPASAFPATATSATTATTPARATAGATARAVTTPQPSVTAQATVPVVQPSPIQQTTPNAAETRPTPVSASAFRLDMDAIFPPGEGREPLFDNCIACHTFLPLLQQKTEADWGMTLTNHRTRYISALPDKDLEAIIKYLAAHFSPDKPLPEPPPHLNWRNWPAY